MNTTANTHSRCPHASSSVETGSTASLSSATTAADVNLNAVNVFEHLECSQILADMCLAGLDNDSVDEFDNPEQSLVCNTDNPSGFNCADFLCTVDDPFDSTKDNVDNIHELVDAGAMVIVLVL